MNDPAMPARARAPRTAAKLWLTVEDAYAVLVGGYERADIWLTPPSKDDRRAARLAGSRSLCKAAGSKALRRAIFACLCTNFSEGFAAKRLSMITGDRSGWDQMMLVPAKEWVGEIDVRVPRTLFLRCASAVDPTPIACISRPGLDPVEEEELMVWRGEPWMWHDDLGQFCMPASVVADWLERFGLAAAAGALRAPGIAGREVVEIDTATGAELSREVAARPLSAEEVARLQRESERVEAR